MMSNFCLFNTYFCFILILAYKRQALNQTSILSKMGMNGFKVSNFKEGGTPQEPWCEYLFTIHNDEGYVYRKGK